MGFPGQEYWSGLPFPSPGDIPNPGIERTSPAWQMDSLPLSYLASPHSLYLYLVWGSKKFFFKGPENKHEPQIT